MAIDPINTSTIYAATFFGSGIYKSTNGGSTWAPTSNGLNSNFLQTLTIDPTDTRTIFAGTSDRGAFKSTDGGASWSGSGLTGSDVLALAVDPSNPSTVYASVGNLGVSKSTNGGSSWSQSNTGLNSFFDKALTIDPSHTSTIYVGGFGFFRSTDGGGRWSAVDNGLTSKFVTAIAIDPSKPDSVYAGTVGGFLQRQFVTTTPEIMSAVFDPPKRLTISGGSFSSSPRVMINDTDRTDFVSSASDTTIQLKGKAKKLGLRSGDNTLQVSDSNGAISNVFIIKM